MKCAEVCLRLKTRTGTMNKPPGYLRTQTALTTISFREHQMAETHATHRQSPPLRQIPNGDSKPRKRLEFLERCFVPLPQEQRQGGHCRG